MANLLLATVDFEPCSSSYDLKFPTIEGSTLVDGKEVTAIMQMLVYISASFAPIKRSNYILLLFSHYCNDSLVFASPDIQQKIKMFIQK